MGRAWFFAAWMYAPLALLALIGLWMVYRGLLWDRSKARRRCPKCWYDMSGAPSEPPVRCPECGHISNNERELTRTRRMWALAAIGAVLLLPLIGFFGVRDARRVYYALPPKWSTVEVIRVGDTVATCYRLRDPDDRTMRAVVRSGGKTILDIDEIDIEFGQDDMYAHTSGKGSRLGVGEDMNGDGVGDLMVFCYSGGAHCCYTVYIVELSSPARVAAAIDAKNSMGVARRPSNDPYPGQVEFDISDQTFDYWHTSHVDSPAPSVWYRLRNHRLEIALDRMVRPLEDVRKEHDGDIKEVAEAGAASPPQLSSRMWGYMLDLLYSGNEKECWEYFDRAWPAGYPSPQAKPDPIFFPKPLTKEAFKAEFLEELSKSAQWRDFQAARAAVAKGEAIPLAIVGQYKPELLGAPAP